MVLYTIKNLSPIKGILKTPSSSDINKYIETEVKELDKNSGEGTWQNGIR